MDREHDPLLDYGRDAVIRPAEAVLGDNVVTHPLNQNKPKRKKRGKKTSRRSPKGTRVVIIAGGFPGYSSEAVELEAIEHGRWSPHTADFSAAASSDFGSSYFEVNDDGELLGALTEQKGKLGRVIIVAHGGPMVIGLSGVHTDGQPRFTNMFDDESLDRWSRTIKSHVVPKLHEAATIDIIACNLAVDEHFMQALANNFERCVRGFTGAIFYRHPANEAGTAIANRGFTGTNDETFEKGIKHLRTQVRFCPEARPE